MISRNAYKNNVTNGYDAIRCLSTDAKPVDDVPNGSTLIEMDTAKTYLFDAENVEWHEVDYVIISALGVLF